MSFTSRRGVATVAAAKAISFLGDEVAAIALVLRLQSTGHGAAAVAALLVANLVPIALISGVAGRLIDRTGGRGLLVGSALVQTGLCAVLAFTSATPLLLALVAALGAGQAVNGATWQALLPAVAGPQHLPRAVAITRMATTAAGIVAPALSGVLTGRYGAHVPLLVDAATFAAVAAAALLLPVRTVPARPSGRPHGGLAIVRRDALLRPVFVLLAVFVLLGSMVNVVEVFLVRDVLDASTTAYGLIGAVLAVGMFAGAAAGGRLSGFRRLARWFVGASVVLGLALVAIGCVPSVLVAAPVGVVLGLANGVLNVTLDALVLGRAAPGERGRVGAMLTGTSSAVQLLAYLAGGLLAGIMGPREIFVLAGGMGLLAPLLLGRRLVRAADLAACPTPTSLPCAGDSPLPAASPAPSPTTSA